MCTCSTSTRPYHSSWRAKCARPSSTDGDQIFVATNAPSRRPSSARASDASAPPYIGDESTSRVPASHAAATTRAGKLRIVAERVPRAEPDDRAEPAFFHQPRSSRAASPAA